jgi:hypothetical protein
MSLLAEPHYWRTGVNVGKCAQRVQINAYDTGLASRLACPGTTDEGTGWGFGNFRMFYSLP